MISYFQDYVTIGAVLGFGLFLVVLLLGVASVLRPNKPYAEKLQTYECGVDPVGTGWSQTYVRYYIFGLLFVIFDVEAVFIFPWAINLEKLGYFGLIGNLIKIIGFTFIGFSFFEYIDTFLMILPATLIGSRIGQLLLLKISNKIFMRIFQLVLIFLAIRLLII